MFTVYCEQQTRSLAKNKGNDSLWGKAGGHKRSGKNRKSQKEMWE